MKEIDLYCFGTVLHVSVGFDSFEIREGDTLLVCEKAWLERCYCRININWTLCKMRFYWFFISNGGVVSLHGFEVLEGFINGRFEVFIRFGVENEDPRNTFTDDDGAKEDADDCEAIKVLKEGKDGWGAKEGLVVENGLIRVWWRHEGWIYEDRLKNLVHREYSHAEFSRKLWCQRHVDQESQKCSCITR